jgi:hypothetical protein
MSADPMTGEIAGPGSGPPLTGPGVTAPSLSGAGRRFLSDILVELEFVSEDEAERAVEAARHPGQTPEKVLLESGAISEDQLARALAERYGLDHIDLTEFPHCCARPPPSATSRRPWDSPTTALSCSRSRTRRTRSASATSP